MITPIYQLIPSTIPPLESTHPFPLLPFGRAPSLRNLPSGQPSPSSGATSPTAYGLYLGRAESIQFNKQTNKQKLGGTKK